MRKIFWANNNRIASLKRFVVNSFENDFVAPEWLLKDFLTMEERTFPVVDDRDEPFKCDGIVMIPEEGLFAEVIFETEKGSTDCMGNIDWNSISLWVRLTPAEAEKLQWEQKEFSCKQEKEKEAKIEEQAKLRLARRLANKILSF